MPAGNNGRGEAVPRPRARGAPGNWESRRRFAGAGEAPPRPYNAVDWSRAVLSVALTLLLLDKRFITGYSLMVRLADG